ncbi:hypothetical protein L1987_10867 [Smallanthus sonchifolius]|uniref:Uncharacterized protein n=1 Tax=Smallanthus sonchifolius TaxID=185202 RepID=A0ACB9J9Y5_9ASTR|nr:hypothetical protein L1987_10867 [Smallanthus sonchifolius]
MMESGRDFDGSELIRFLTLIIVLRSRSFSTAWSSAQSQTQLMEDMEEASSVKEWLVGLSKMLFIALLLICLGSQLESYASNHRFNKGDIIPFYANRVGPFSNSQETYAYYDLPYCSPDTVKEESLNLGEMLNGDRLVSTPYKFEFLVDKDYEVFCNKTLRKTDVSKFRNAIKKDYYMQLYFDDLPLWAFIGNLQKNYTNEGINSISILNTHFEFEVFYNKDRVIEANL